MNCRWVVLTLEYASIAECDRAVGADGGYPRLVAVVGANRNDRWPRTSRWMGLLDWDYDRSRDCDRPWTSDSQWCVPRLKPGTGEEAFPRCSSPDGAPR